MAVLVVLNKSGIEANSNRYFYNILGDPSALGLPAAVGSIAMQDDSNPKGQLWEKTSASDTGWALIATSQSAGASSSTGSWRASAFNVPIDGTTDATAALNTLAGTTMPQSGGPFALIVGPGETIKLASDVTLPATVQLQSTGGAIKPASGKVLTVNAQPTGTGTIFDISAGGVIVAGTPMSLDPNWFGADRTGANNSSPAFGSALWALAGQAAQSNTIGGGGKLRIPSGTYKMSDYGQQFGADYSYISIEGDGPSSLLLNGTARTAAPDFRGLLSFFGGSAFGLKELRLRHFRMSGVSNADATRMITCDQLERMYFDDVTIENNAVEGIYSGSNDTNIRLASFANCHARNIGIGFNVAAFNLNAAYVTYTNCTFDSCAIGIENMGRFTTVTSSLFKDCSVYCVMFQSTWSGFLDASFVEENTYGSVISGNQFINCPGRAVLMPDYTGHANGDLVHTLPAHLDGGLGQILIQGNLFDRVNYGVWGGADKSGPVDCSGNMFSGQYDAGTGPQAYAVSPEGGTWKIHNNTFQIGLGIQWASLMGNLVGRSGGPTRVTVADNTVMNLCWGGGPAFALYHDDTIRSTRFLDLDGTIAAASDAPLYQFFDTAGTVVAWLKTNDWVWSDPDHQFSMHAEPSKIPVSGDTLPPFMQFKPGDQLVNRGSTAKWFNKRCSVGGTTNPTALTCTGAATSGTKTLTVSSATGLGVYSWISVPAVPAITNKQILAISGTTITVDTNFEAAVTAGTAISWATPVFVTDRDLNTMSIASQAAGDMIAASTTSAFARVPKGLDGTYLAYVSGFPTATDSFARFDAGNSSTAMTITRTPARQEQKFTLTTATPVITIDDTAIPSGGYLVTDAFQDPTGSRVPTWALTSTNAINWVGGSAPTLTTTLNKADRIVWHNEGSRITAWLALANF